MHKRQTNGAFTYEDQTVAEAGAVAVSEDTVIKTIDVTAESESTAGENNNGAITYGCKQ